MKKAMLISALHIASWGAFICQADVSLTFWFTSLAKMNPYFSAD